jgi:hypothetical protein
VVLSILRHDLLRAAVRVAVVLGQAMDDAQALAIDRHRARRPLFDGEVGGGADRGSGERGRGHGENGEDGGKLHDD